MAGNVFEVLDARTVEILERRRNTSRLKRRGWLVRRALLTADVVGLTSAFVVAELVYSSQQQAGVLSQVTEVLTFVLFIPAWVVAAKLYGLYDKDEERADHSTTDDFVRLFHLLTVSTFLLFAVSTATRWFNPQFSKLFLFWLLALVSTALLRATSRSLCRRHISYLQNTVIVGAGEVGQTIARKVLHHPEYGINLVGFIDDQPKERIPGLEHLTVLGPQSDMPELIRLLDVERVVFAFSNETHQESLELIRSLSDHDVQVDIVPRFFEVLSPGIDVHTVEGVPILGLPSTRLPLSSRFLKRAVDIGGSFVGLLLLAPALVVIAIAIKLDSPGPVFFRQVRVGVGGRQFRIWKFRTMAQDADTRKSELAHLNKHLLPGGDPRMFKIDRDPRATRVGSWLRRSSLDELPQLINVLRGEMSLVGPRPLILDEHRHVSKWGFRRLEIKPGITGLWQVLGRDDIGFSEMLRLDYLYVSTWTLGKDFKLLFGTLPALLRSGH
jgi:exopolysaccharide biosynthesis polyprenyl glycosylphosphotransferase